MRHYAGSPSRNPQKLLTTRPCSKKWKAAWPRRNQMQDCRAAIGFVLRKRLLLKDAVRYNYTCRRLFFWDPTSNVQARLRPFNLYRGSGHHCFDGILCNPRHVFRYRTFRHSRPNRRSRCSSAVPRVRNGDGHSTQREGPDRADQVMGYQVVLAYLHIQLRRFTLFSDFKLILLTRTCR